MKTIKINGTTLPAVGIGTWNVGDHPADRQAEIDAIRASLDQVARVIDTAEMYGNGKSERLVGSAITDYQRDQLFIIDKVLPTNAGKTRLEKSLDQSLANVGTDYFDLYLLHWRGSIPLAETVAELERMVAKGKIRSWGVSNFDVADLDELWQLPGGDHCVANEDLYNLDERGIEYDLIPLMKKRHCPLIAYSPLAQGDQLSGKLADNPVIKSLAAAHHATVYQVMLAWTIREDNVLTIPKSGSVKHALANWQAGSIEFTAAELATLKKAFPSPTSKQPLAVI